MASIDSQGPLRVAHTEIVGNALTRSETIERHLQQVYAAETIGDVATELVQASKQLERLGVFEHVDLVLHPSSLPGHGNLVVTVKEKRILSLKATTFLEQGEGGVEVSARALNALGSAESLEFSALMGGSDVKLDAPKHSAVQVAYTHPNPYNSDAVLMVTADASSQHPLEAPYEEVSYGTQVKIKRGAVQVDWTARQRDICPIRRNLADGSFDVSEQVLQACRPSLKSSLGVQIALGQYFPNPFAPQAGQGNFLRLDVSHPSVTGGNVALVSLTAKTKRVQPLGEDGVCLVTSFEASACRTPGNGFIHVQDRYYLGGPMFLRGFNPRGCNALGGRNKWQCRVALEGPPPAAVMFGNQSDAVRAHLFACAGALSNETSLKALLVDELRVSCGLGVAFAIGLGRIEANLVYAVKAHKADALSGRMQVGIAADFL